MFQSNQHSRKNDRYDLSHLLDWIFEEIAERINSKLQQPQKPEYISARKLAQILDCSVSEVRQKIQKSRLPILPFGSRGYRISMKEVEKRLARWHQGADFWD